MDSSALLAVVLGEPDAYRFALAMTNAPIVRMSAANWLEAAMRVDGQRPEAAREFDEIVAHIGIEIVPVSPAMAVAARDANQHFGRRSGSKAKLNFGDCFAYALSHVTGEPLLFKGDDFPHTDIVPAMA